MIKQILCTLLLLFIIGGLVKGQNVPVPSKSFDKNGYQAWVKLTDSSIVHGLLWNVDSAFVEIKTDQVKDWKSPNSNAVLQRISAGEIQSIRTKKVRAVLKGYGWGAIIGNSFGFLAAATAEISDPGSDDYILLVPMCGLLGSFTGLIAGALPDKTFEFEGRSSILLDDLSKLDKRAFWKSKK